jgi:hypothetical protein
MADFRMHLVLAVSSALTGRNVPAPTCNVTKAGAMPRCIQARKQRVGEMQARRGGCHRAFLAGVDGLVILAVARVFARLEAI